MLPQARAFRHADCTEIGFNQRWKNNAPCKNGIESAQVLNRPNMRWKIRGYLSKYVRTNLMHKGRAAIALYWNFPLPSLHSQQSCRWLPRRLYAGSFLWALLQLFSLEQQVRMNSEHNFLQIWGPMVELQWNQRGTECSTNDTSIVPPNFAPASVARQTFAEKEPVKEGLKKERSR